MGKPVGLKCFALGTSVAYDIFGKRQKTYKIAYHKAAKGCYQYSYKNLFCRAGHKVVQQVSYKEDMH